MRAMTGDLGTTTRLGSVWAQKFAGGVLAPTGSTAVHDFMALAYVTGGAAVVRQGEQFEVRAGDVYLVPAGERHGMVTACSPEAWGIGFCPACFAGTELAPLLDPFARAASGASKVVAIPGARQEHLANLCAELHREATAGSALAHGELVRRSLLTLILAEVTRAGTDADGVGAQSGWVADALRFIERSCLGPLSLADVARVVHRSPSHVSTVVRRATGRSVTEWILAGRLAEARNRLVHTDEMIDVIAERVGYADPTHFIRLFRRAHGCTPAAWRARERASTGRRA